jgi:hypothetical protein
MMHNRQDALTQDVMIELQDTLSYADLPFDAVYVAEAVKQFRKKGLQDCKDIAGEILMSITEERPGSDGGPFDYPRNIPISIFEASGTAGMLIQYSLSALENGYPSGAKRAMHYARSLLFDISEESMNEDTVYYGDEPPGAQIMYLSQPAVAVLARIFEDAVRLYNKRAWVTPADDPETHDNWIEFFHDSGARLRELNLRYGINGNPTPHS